MDECRLASRISLRVKLLVACLGLGLVPLTVVGCLVLAQARSALETKAYAQLDAVREIKRAEIEDFFARAKSDLDTVGDMTQSLHRQALLRLDAVQELKRRRVEALWKDLPQEIASVAAHQVVGNTFERAKRYHDESNASPEGGLETKDARYAAIYAEVGPAFRKLAAENGYDDLLLVCRAHGHVLCSARRRSDLGTNLRTGSGRAEVLARTWRQVVDTEQVAIGDFAAYTPADSRYLAVLAAPVHVDGEFVAVVVATITSERFDEIVQPSVGLGKTGETYLVGRDARGIDALRSNMLTMDRQTYKTGYEVSTRYIERALAGETGHDFTVDTRNILVVASFAPLAMPGVHWAQVTKIDVEEAIAIREQGESADVFGKWLETTGYYDLFLIDPSGFVFYTVAREDDYRSDLRTGPYADSGLGSVFREACESKSFAFADFAPYAPTGGEPASFIAQPLLGSDGEVECVLALQLSANRIDPIMMRRDGMGETGQTYLVAADGGLRSTSPLDPEAYSMEASFQQDRRLESEPITLGLSGLPGHDAVTGAFGEPVLASFAPVDAFDHRWVLVAEVGQAEAFAAITRLTWVLVIAGGVATVLVLVVSSLVTRRIVGPLRRICATLGRASGEVSSASADIAQSSQQLASGANEQASALEESAATLEQMAVQAGSNATAARAATAGLEAIAKLAHENASSARQAEGLTQAAGDAVERGVAVMGQIEEAMHEMRASNASIEAIVDVIAEITQQTKMLATNAAIEAALAGERGKGFAVVANEVGKLAESSKHSAREIAALIRTSREKTDSGEAFAREGADALAEIRVRTSEAVGLVGQIAAAVGEESRRVSTVQEQVEAIDKAASEQAQGVEQIRTATQQMEQVTQRNAAGAEETASATEELSSLAVSLDAIIDEVAELIGGARAAAGSGGEWGSSAAPQPVLAPSSVRNTAASSRAVAQPVLSEASV